MRTLLLVLLVSMPIITMELDHASKKMLTVKELEESFGVPFNESKAESLTYDEFMILLANNDIELLASRCRQEQDRLKSKIGETSFMIVRAAWPYGNVLALQEQAQKQEKPFFFTFDGVKALVGNDAIIIYHKLGHTKLQKAEWLAMVMP